MGVTAAVAGTAAAVNSLSGGAITNAITGGGGGSGSAGTASGASGAGGASGSGYDPYGPYRGQAASQLNTLMNNPATAMSQPGYQQTLQQGMRTAQRGAAATGQLQSGAEQMALQDVGQQTFGAYYNQQLANLMQLSGASQSPASAGFAQQQAANVAQQRQFGAMNQFSSGLGGIAQGASALGGYFSGGNTNIMSAVSSTPDTSWQYSGAAGQSTPSGNYSAQSVADAASAMGYTSYQPY